MILLQGCVRIYSDALTCVIRIMEVWDDAERSAPYQDDCWQE
jgi:hypothetical protein